MQAAIVRAFGTPPSYGPFADPQPAGENEIVVDVLAAGLHPRVRSQANGSHYTSTGVLPLIPGVDGVARMPDGRLVYFVLSDTTRGSMAEMVVVDVRRSVGLPEGVDPVAVAAGMNPAMSSWIALRRRIEFEPGQKVLVLGATGNAGQLAVQVARHLGASQVVAAGRDRVRLDGLSALGADAIVSLEGDDDSVALRLAAAAAEVDVVVDYLWGRPAQRAMTALMQARADRSRRLSWIQIGSVAGPDISLASATLRGSNLHLLGSGQGSASTAGFVAELPELARLISDGTFTLNARPMALADVARAWAYPQSGGERIVLTP